MTEPLIHEFPVRIYYEDTDAGGIVYHARYLAFAERARTEMLRQAGFGQTDIKDQFGVLYAVRSAELDYRRSAVLDDALMVRSKVVHVGGASVRLVQDVMREDDILCRMTITLVSINEQGRPVRMPEKPTIALKYYFHPENDTNG